MSPNTARFPLGKLTNWYRQCRVTTVFRLIPVNGGW